MGHGPRVPSGKLTVALALDRIKAAARTGAAVVRLHPAGSTLPVVFFSVAAVIFVLMATVSIHVLPAAPRSAGQEPVVGGVTPVPATSAPVSQGITSPGGSRGGASRMDTVPGRLAARQLSSSGTSAAGSRGLPSSAQASGAGPTGSSASQAAGTGSRARPARDQPGGLLRFPAVHRVVGFLGVRGDLGLWRRGFGQRRGERQFRFRGKFRIGQRGSRQLCIWWIGIRQFRIRRQLGFRHRIGIGVRRQLRVGRFWIWRFGIGERGRRELCHGPVGRGVRGPVIDCPLTALPP